MSFPQIFVRLRNREFVVVEQKKKGGSHQLPPCLFTIFVTQTSTIGFVEVEVPLQPPAQSRETKAVVGAAEQPPTLAKSREKKSTICAAETREAEVYAPLVSEQPPALAKSREKKSANKSKEEEKRREETRRPYPSLQPPPSLVMESGLWLLELTQFGKLLNGAAFLDRGLLQELASISIRFLLVKVMTSLIRGCL